MTCLFTVIKFRGFKVGEATLQQVFQADEIKDDETKYACSAYYKMCNGKSLVGNTDALTYW
jgi:hypothetical protein